MKQLLFRAWDKKDQVYRYVVAIDFVNKQVELAPTYEELEGGTLLHRSTDQVELEQFCELWDEDNVHLHEKDIIERWGEKVLIDHLFTVGYMLNECTLSNKEFKIIGNIHQDPELLK